jgi:adenosylmethionine-8-amino-7-oxononanoate aminotransferase
MTGFLMLMRITGFGATGKFWCHEHWQLNSPPDMVTFSKKAQTAGYFFGDRQLIPDKAYRQFNTLVTAPQHDVIKANHSIAGSVTQPELSSARLSLRRFCPRTSSTNA